MRLIIFKLYIQFISKIIFYNSLIHSKFQRTKRQFTMLEIENEKFENERRAKDERIENLENEATNLNEKLVILKMDFEAKATEGQEVQARLKEELKDLTGEMLALRKKRKAIWIENMEEETRKRRNSILEKRKRTTNLLQVEEEKTPRGHDKNSKAKQAESDGDSSTSQPVRSSNLDALNVKISRFAETEEDLANLEQIKSPRAVTVTVGQEMGTTADNLKVAGSKVNGTVEDNLVSLKVTDIAVKEGDESHDNKYVSGSSGNDIPDLMRVKSTLAEKDNNYLGVANDCEDKIKEYNKKMYKLYTRKSKG